MKKIKNFFGNIFGGKKANAKVVPKVNAKNAAKGQKIPKKNLKKGKKIVAKGAKLGKKGKANVVRKTRSVESVFNVKPRTQTPERFYSRLTPINGIPPGQHVFDVCAYVICCPKHNRIALAEEERTAFRWLPFVSLPAARTWSDGAKDGANIILSNGDANTFLELKNRPVISSAFCMQLFRLQLPQTQKFNTRLIYYLKLNTNESNFRCCVNTDRIRWFRIKDVIESKVDKLWGPEVVEYTRYSTSTVIQRIEEYSLDQAFFYVPRDPPRNLEEELLKSTNYSDKDVERIYGDFVEHCFPAFYMTLTSFSDYMTKYGFERRDKQIYNLFKAFNFNNSGFLSFSEFLIGLTSIEPNAYNGQSRIKLVFKFFDVNKDGFLTTDEFEEMVRQIYPKESKTQIKEKVEKSMKRIGVQKNRVSFEDFFKACGSHRFRGTSLLCRSKRSIVTQISRSMATRSLRRTTEKSDSSFASLLSQKQYKGVCDSCHQKTFDFALHSVRINSDGRCVGAKRLPEWDQIERSNKPVDTVVKKSSSSALNVSNISRERFSIDLVWNPKSIANYFLEQIRAFNIRKGTHKDNKGLMDGLAQRSEFVKRVEELCSEMEKIVVQEERCVQMSAPAFVIGDIHGNLEDLMTLEKVLWKSIPIVSSNFLFLGDYVDRGKWGLECALYLMCLKLLAPNKVVLLRGNHEVRDLQMRYSYKQECLRKYGDNFGPKVFEMTNRVFDKLPVCAVIDDAIFCAHGGIPCSTRLIDQINELVKPDLRDPERDSAIAWEILWSDPIDAQQFSETADLLGVRVESARGFLTNNKRGTAYLFAEEAVNNFLQNNGLTHIVRAHEVPAQGFAFHFGNKCTTIFSSSHYCGNNNRSACVHIDNEKLRILRLDTVNNLPASD